MSKSLKLNSKLELPSIAALIIFFACYHSSAKNVDKIEISSRYENFCFCCNCELYNSTSNALLINFILFLGGPYPGQQGYSYGAPDQYGPPPQPPGQYPPAQGQFPPPNRTMYPPYGGSEGDT